MTNRRRLVIWANLLPACHTISALFLMRGVTMGMLSTLETLTAVAGRGHAAVLQGVDLQGVIKTGRGNVAKKWLRFHALVKLLSDYQ